MKALHELERQALNDKVSLMLGRWVVPLLYALCVAVLWLDQLESYRRLRLAEEVARKLRDHPPRTLENVETLLGERVKEVRLITSAPDGGAGNAEEVGRALVSLRPQVWLSPEVEYVPEFSHITGYRLVASGSTELPLENPGSELNTRPNPLAAFAATLFAAGFGWGWRLASQRLHPMWKAMIGAALCAVPLLLYLPAALVLLFRIWM